MTKKIMTKRIKNKVLSVTTKKQKLINKYKKLRLKYEKIKEENYEKRNM